ncbi:long-chain fatty acid--CoA ligase [Alloacidobacterium sp.]|uniref:AMP-dependent synthetase/ligase n=1 Tax=Alloacidobacterium sp. TaxID=2951999 RepID=UPI002D35CCA7|nr:long-chain fatty acid--CoA ligase [Alloacidobacterium sp.]HYK34966.1 long-chain fatty acid--CoA ligase [Alloacidobacterium sp.]
MLQLKTLNDIFFLTATSSQPRCVLYMDAAGKWQAFSGMQMYQRVRAFAEALAGWGIKKGDRVAILGENRWEWAVADFAALAMGVVDVPIYPTLTAQQIGALLADSGTRVAVVSSKQQYDKVASVRSKTVVEKIVLMDDEGVADAVLMSSLLKDADSHGTKRDAVFDRAAYDVAPDDLATLIYTSGTTGEPKGVMLTHGNIASNVNYSLAGFEISQNDSCISFLPLSHITARHLDYAIYTRQATVAYCPNFDKLPAALKEIRPTVLVAVPRVFEKVRQEAERQASLSGVKKRIFGWAVKTGQKHREQILRGDTPSSLGWKLANKLVFSKIQSGFGGRVRYYIAGGAPLGMDTASWFAGVGIRILEGYGLTETSPVLAINTTAAYRIGSVGKPLPNIECRMAEDGELLVRGPNVFSGYWHKPDQTAEVFDAEGWFRTGDIGRIDEDGFLFITDRKKELLKTSGGKLVAPQPIENKLKAFLFVGQAAVVGDKHKFLSALISPNFAALEEWARQQGISAPTRRELVSDPAVTAKYQAIVDEVNGTLAQFETVKRFCVVPEEWSLAGGELTPSLKLKRRVVNEKYAAEITAFYPD